MTVSSTTNRNDYIGNGNVDTYSFNFKIFDGEEDTLLVTVRDPDTGDETTLTLNTHYTVTGDGETSGGSVALVNGAFDWLDAGGDLEVDWALSIRRVLPLTQETDIRNQGAYFPEIHENQFDRLVMIEQQQDDEIDRALKLPETIAGSAFDTELPGLISDSTSAGCALIINDTYDGFEIGPNAADISTAQANAAAALASEVAAAASAAAAAASASGAAGVWHDVIFHSGSDLTISSTQKNKVVNFDTGAANRVVTLPQISGLTLTGGFVVTILKKANSYADTTTITINCGGTDTFGGALGTSIVLRTEDEGVILIPDVDSAPDRWVVIPVHPRVIGYNQLNNIATAYSGAPTADLLPITDASALVTKKVQASDVRRLGVATKSATFTATEYEEVIFVSASGGAVTANLYAASGKAGKRIRIVKTDTTFTAVTIDPNAAETVGGSATTTLNTEGEAIDIVCDGSNWLIENRIIPSKWTSATPTGSWVSNATYAAKRRRVGDTEEWDVTVTCSGLPTAANLTITLPRTTDTAKLSNTTSNDSMRLGFGVATDSGSARYPLTVYYDTSTTVNVRATNAAGTYDADAGATNLVPFTFGSGDTVQLRFVVPVSGWNA